MQAGLTASVRQRSGRHLRFVTLAAALATINISLWIRLVLAGGAPVQIGDMAFAATIATVAILAMLALWRNPLGRSTAVMTTPALRQLLATHHAGHVVAAHINEPGSGPAADMSQQCQRHTTGTTPITRSELQAELVITLSGMAAEEIFAGETGAHVQQDLAYATAIGANMVSRYGMAGSLVSLGTPRPSKTTFVKHVLDDPRARKELESILREAKRESVRLMLENRQTIIAVRDALLRNHRLAAGQINEIIAGAEDVRRGDDEVLVDLRIVSNRDHSIANVSQL